MRPIILSGIRAILVAFLIASLVDLPLMAASEKPLGMVVAASHAQLDSANAATGADIYTGDVLATDPTGSMRMRIGGSELFLQSSSSASLAPQGDKVHAKVDSGTVSFSTPNQLEIETPLGVVRSADGQRVLGAVMILSPKSIRVSSFEGTLLVASANGQEQKIEEGQTYEGDLLPAATSGGGNGSGTIHAGGYGINWWHVALAGMIAGGLAIGAWRIWHYESESCYYDKCICNTQPTNPVCH